MALQRAERRKSPLKVGFSGPSGSGKTYSALLAAHGMTGNWEKIAVIDTENRSAELYSHLGGYFVNPLTAPFPPEKYIEAIAECEKAGIQVIIIDSITHEWDGVGGCLELQAQYGGKYQDWAKVTPRHQKFINAIIQSPCHVFTTVRRKQDYDMAKDANGKLTVTKVGTKEVTREGFEYELTLSMEIDINHMARASKDRTGLFSKRPEFVIDERFGAELLKWHDSGAAVERAPEPVVAVSDKDRVRETLKSVSSTKGVAVVKAAIAGIGYSKFDDVPPEKYPELLKALA
jgi:hypothetical protein